MQSLLKDHDLRIDNNHAQRDYEAYFDGDLDPHAIAPGKGGGRLLGASDRAAAARCAGVCGGRLPRRRAADADAGLGHGRAGVDVGAAGHRFGVRGDLRVVRRRRCRCRCSRRPARCIPEIPAALALMIAVADRHRRHGRARLDRQARQTAQRSGARSASACRPPCCRGSTSRYAPASGVLLLIGVWRLWRESTRRAPPSPPIIARGRQSTAPASLGWLAYGYVIWGSPWPSAPYGGAGGTQTSLAGARAGRPRPALRPGIRRPELRAGARHRAGGLLDALAHRRAGARHRRGTGPDAGRAVPDRRRVPDVVGRRGAARPPDPVGAAAARRCPPRGRSAPPADRPERRAAYRLLLLVGVGINLACVLALDGRLLGLERTGVSPFLGWLSPDWHLWAFFPDFVMAALVDRARCRWPCGPPPRASRCGSSGGWPPQPAPRPGSTRTGRGLRVPARRCGGAADGAAGDARHAARCSAAG